VVESQCLSKTLVAVFLKSACQIATSLTHRHCQLAFTEKAMTKAFHRSSFAISLGARTRPVQRLGIANGRCENQNIRWPSFDHQTLRPGILHFGCGAFHRAHQNVFTQRAIELEGSSAWGVVGVSFRSRKIRQLLAPQDFLYTVLERGGDHVSAQVVGVLRDVLFARAQRSRVIASFADPRTRIVTLTITPSGYLPDAAPVEVPWDSPVDPIGILVEGLATIRARGTAPPVLISCDNMPANGRRLRQTLLERADRESASLAHWIDRNVQSPSSVVDRIVPVPTSEDGAAATGLLGLQDLAAVATEPFRQWVIEDFEGPRPSWERAGATYVSDVAAWEASKLRLLNGTHMAIAFLGMLSQLETVSDFVLDPLYLRYVSRLMVDEQVPTIPPSNHDLIAYCCQLLERWQNRYIVHQLQRIARNGAEKLQPRLLDSVRENIVAGRSSPCTVLAVAAWACCTARMMPYAGNLEDDAAPALQDLAATSGDTRDFVRRLLCRRDIFGTELPQVPTFGDQLAEAIDLLRLLGARGAVSRVLMTAARVST
jgi:fructuronate reductase